MYGYMVKDTRGMQIYHEACRQLPRKHEAIQLVSAICHEVTLVSHTPAVQCQEKSASLEQTAVQTMVCSCASAEEQLACKQRKQSTQTVLQDMQTD